MQQCFQLYWTAPLEICMWERPTWIAYSLRWDQITSVLKNGISSLVFIVLGLALLSKSSAWWIGLIPFKFINICPLKHNYWIGLRVWQLEFIGYWLEDIVRFFLLPQCQKSTAAEASESLEIYMWDIVNYARKPLNATKYESVFLA